MNKSPSIEAFVISIDAETRNASLYSQIKREGIASRWVPAVDMRGPGPELADHLYDGRTCNAVLGRPISRAEAGCALSHLKAARLAFEASLDWVLVIEDDAILGKNISPVIERAVELDSGRPMVFTLHSTNVPLMISSSKKQLGDDGLGVIGRLYLPPSSTVAYLMNRGAIELFSQKNRVQGLADWPPWSYSVDFWGCFPWPVQTGDTSASTLAAAREAALGPNRPTGLARSMLRKTMRLLHPGRVYFHSRALNGFWPYFSRVLLRQLALWVAAAKRKIAGPGAAGRFGLPS